eukprot:10830108-Alexandrium_andersonii.AAC.1
MSASLVGSEMCIRDRLPSSCQQGFFGRALVGKAPAHLRAPTARTRWEHSSTCAGCNGTLVPA